MITETWAIGSDTGRSGDIEQCDRFIVVPGAEHLQAMIVFSDDGIHLYDLSQAGDTALNGVPMEGQGRVPLTLHDVITIARQDLRVEFNVDIVPSHTKVHAHAIG